MKKRTTRRNFLSLAAAGGLAGAAGIGFAGGPSQQRARALGDAESDRFYIFCYFGGGWDVLLSLDPRDPGLFSEENLSTTRILPGYDRLPAGFQERITVNDTMTFGPYIGDLRNHTDKMAIIRGMSMETASHYQGRDRFLTGRAPSGLNARGSSGSTWLATHFGGAEPLPQLSVGVPTYNKELPNWATALRVRNAADVVGLLQPTAPVFDDVSTREISRLLEQSASCDRALHSPALLAAESARLRTKQLFDEDLKSFFDFGASTPEMEALRSRYNPDGGSGTLRGPAERAAMAAVAITNGISRTVSFGAAGGSLDTHFENWATAQGPNQLAGFNAIARMIEHLQETPFEDTGESYLDRTTIVAFSEFARTPAINIRSGRDHWPTSSCMLLGGNIRGNTIIGASSDVGMSAQAVDLETGRVDRGGEIIRPEHIHRTLQVDAGIEEDEADLRVEPITALMRT